MKKIFLPLFAIIILASVAFTAGTSSITRSAINFQIKNMGIGVTGAVGGLQADIQFEPSNLVASSITASVDVNTLSTDNSSRDEHLKSADFFDVSKYPRITLKSISFRHKSGNNFVGQFNLTIKNKTKRIEIPFSVVQKDGALSFKGNFKLNRLDYGVGDSSVILSDDVTVNIEADVKA